PQVRAAAVPPASTPAVRQAADDWPTPVRPGSGAATPPRQPQPPAPAAGGGPVQQVWPQVLEAVKRRQRVAWMILNAQGRLLGVENNVVTIGFEKPGDVQGFLKGKRDEVVAAALGDVLGGTWRVEVVVGGSGPGGPTTRAASSPQPPVPQAPPVAPAAPPAAPAAPPAAPAATASAQAAPAAAERQPAAPSTTDETWPDAPSDDYDDAPPPPSRPTPGPGLAAARSAARAAAQTGPRKAWPETVPGRTGGTSRPDDDVDPLNDDDADVSELTGMALIQRELGGQIIEEIDHS
ncbi:MAG: DNA polymerase III subunit gamma and tau, partial [Microbispora sp.]|nr:DNA polymerase III subunit gamma and tau [Microbispora sp.]